MSNRTQPEADRSRRKPFHAAWPWLLLAIYALTPAAYAVAPRLQVESSYISGGESLAISPDGRLLAEHQDGVVTLRDGLSGLVLRSWRVSGEKFTGFLQLCFPTDHKILVVVNGSHFDLWDTATGTLLEWHAETEWSNVQDKVCIPGVGVLTQNTREAKARQLKFSGLRLPDGSSQLPQLEVPEDRGRRHRLMAVPGGKFVAIAQYPDQSEDSKPPRTSLSLSDVASGRTLWQVPDIPSHVQFGEIRSLAVSPDGRYLAYVQQSRNRGETLATHQVKGPVEVLEPASGKRLQLPGLRGRQAQRVAFVNHGTWLLIAEENPDILSFFDLQTGMQVHRLPGRFKALFNGNAQSIIVQKSNDDRSSIVDLPTFAERARIGRATAAVQSLTTIQQRLLVAGGNNIKEVPVLAPSQGLDIQTPSKDFVYDAQTARIAYALGDDDRPGSVQGTLRLNNGQRRPFRLPRGDIIWDAHAAAFVPSGKLLVTGHRPADVKRYQALFEQELENFGSDRAETNSAQAFARSMRTRFYWVDDAGKVTSAGEISGVPTLLRLAPQGRQLWLAMDQALVALGLPALDEQHRIDTGDDIFDFQFLPDGRSIFVQSDKSLSIWRDGKRTASFETEYSSTSLAGPQGGFYIAEQQKLWRWFPERQAQAILPVPRNALVSEALSHYVVRGAQGAERIDLASGRKQSLGALCLEPVRLAPDGRYLICARTAPEKYPRQYVIIDAAAEREIQTFQHAGDASDLGFSADGTQVYYIQREYRQQRHQSVYSYMALEVSSGATLPIFRSDDILHGRGIRSSDDGSVVGIALAAPLDKPGSGAVKIFKKAQGQFTLLTSIENQSTQNIQSLDISPQGDLVAFGNHAFLFVHQTADGARLQHIQTSASSGVRFAPSGRAVAGLQLTGQAAAVYDLASGRLVQDFSIPASREQALQQLHGEPARWLTLTRHGIIEPTAQGARLHAISAKADHKPHETLLVDDAAIKSMAQLSPALLALLREDGLITLFNPEQRAVLARIAMMPSGNWVVIAPDGRFDTGALEDLAALHWVMPDEPHRPLPLELFMRQYYEPGLLQKLVHGLPLPTLPDLAALNRAQPKVTIAKVDASADPQRVDVTLKFEQGEYAGLRNGQAITERSGLRHVRLFRNGQLVGTLLDESGPDNAMPTSWTFRNIRLPAGKARREVEFSAYAFNRDGVKGPTHGYRHHAAQALDAPARAVIVSIGVNQYENPLLDLVYAGNDARTFGKSLTTRLKKSGRYGEVVNHTLVSDQTTPQAARKQTIRSLFEGLSGKGGNTALPALRPDDTLILFFAGHGVLDGRGEFYLVPHDIDPALGGDTLMRYMSRMNDDTLKRYISSQELAAWLRDIDAREIVLVVDACQSAGVVGDKTFKPGPMGSRGLGQLAYDKGMRILAATQADDVALEVGKLQHGMLTYALVRNGLEQAQADFRPKDGAVHLGEWLHYAIDGVPRLAQQVIEQQQSGRGVQLKARGSEQSLKDLQQPALFDFRRSRARELRLQ